MKKRFVSRWSRDTNILARVVTGVKATPDSLLERQRMTELLSIDSFARGSATLNDFRTLCDMLNVAETFAKTGVGHEVLSVCANAQAILERCKVQWEDEGRMQFSEEERKAIHDLYEYHHVQRTSVDWQQYEKTITKTANRIRSAHPDVKELV